MYSRVMREYVEEQFDLGRIKYVGGACCDGDMYLLEYFQKSMWLDESEEYYNFYAEIWENKIVFVAELDVDSEPDDIYVLASYINLLNNMIQIPGKFVVDFGDSVVQYRYVLRTDKNVPEGSSILCGAAEVCNIIWDYGAGLLRVYLDSSDAEEAMSDTIDMIAERHAIMDKTFRDAMADVAYEENVVSLKKNVQEYDNDEEEDYLKDVFDLTLNEKVLLRKKLSGIDSDEALMDLFDLDLIIKNEVKNAGKALDEKKIQSTVSAYVEVRDLCNALKEIDIDEDDNSTKDLEQKLKKIKEAIIVAFVRRRCFETNIANCERKSRKDDLICSFRDDMDIMGFDFCDGFIRVHDGKKNPKISYSEFEDGELNIAEEGISIDKHGKSKVLYVGAKCDNIYTQLLKDIKAFVTGTYQDDLYEKTAKEIKNLGKNIENMSYAELSELSKQLERYPKEFTRKIEKKLLDRKEFKARYEISLLCDGIKEKSEEELKNTLAELEVYPEEQKEPYIASINNLINAMQEKKIDEEIIAAEKEGKSALQKLKKALLKGKEYQLTKQEREEYCAKISEKIEAIIELEIEEIIAPIKVDKKEDILNGWDKIESYCKPYISEEKIDEIKTKFYVDSMREIMDDCLSENDFSYVKTEGFNYSVYNYDKMVSEAFDRKKHSQMSSVEFNKMKISAEDIKNFCIFKLGRDVLTTTDYYGIKFENLGVRMKRDLFFDINLVLLNGKEKVDPNSGFSDKEGFLGWREFLAGKIYIAQKIGKRIELGKLEFEKTMDFLLKYSIEKKGVPLERWWINQILNQIDGKPSDLAFISNPDIYERDSVNKSEIHKGKKKNVSKQKVKFTREESRELLFMAARLAYDDYEEEELQEIENDDEQDEQQEPIVELEDKNEQPEWEVEKQEQQPSQSSSVNMEKTMTILDEYRQNPHNLMNYIVSPERAYYESLKKKAVSRLKIVESKEQIVFMYDATMFFTMRDGFVITSENIYDLKSKTHHELNGLVTIEAKGMTQLSITFEDKSTFDIGCSIQTPEKQECLARCLERIIN